MTKRQPDQAEGLRRLFVADMRRMIGVLSSSREGEGHSIVSGLAAALARQGRKVLLLDESLSAGDRHQAFDISIKHDLATALMRQSAIESAIMRTAAGVDVLAGGDQARMLPRPRMEARIGLVNAFYRLAGEYDVVLINAGAHAIHNQPSFAWACQDVIVLCGGQPDAATEAYGHIKSLHQAGERRFHLLFKGIGEERAQSLHRNVAAVSRRYLHLMPELLGLLPPSLAESADFFEQLADKVQTWPLPEHKTGHFPALMRRLLAGANTQALQAMAK